MVGFEGVSWLPGQGITKACGCGAGKKLAYSRECVHSEHEPGVQQGEGSSGSCETRSNK